MKILLKVLKVLLAVIFGGIIGWFGSIVMHIIAWDADRETMVDLYDDSVEYLHKTGFFQD